MHPEEKLKSHITVDVHWRAMCKLWICLDCPQHCPTLKLQEIEDLHRWRNTDRAFMEADIHQARAGHFSVRSCRSHRTCGEERAQVEMVLFILFCLAFSFGRASKKRRMARHTYAEASTIRIVFTCLTVLVASCCNCYFYVSRVHVSIRLLIPALCEGDTKARCPGGKSQKWYCIWCSNSICKRKLRCTGIYIYIFTYIYICCMRPELFCHAIRCINIKDITNHHYRFQIWTHTGFILQQSQNIKKLLHLDKHPATVQKSHDSRKRYGKQRNGGSEFGHGQERLNHMQTWPNRKASETKPRMVWQAKKRSAFSKHGTTWQHKNRFHHFGKKKRFFQLFSLSGTNILGRLESPYVHSMICLCRVMLI